MGEETGPDSLEVSTGRVAKVGTLDVSRTLPQRRRRTVGPWCFADGIGPADVDDAHGLNVGPHPHAGLHTVTWLTSGSVLHRDSLGSEQVIRPGQVNLMSAGRGVTHSEETTGHYRGVLQGIQLWVAQPEGPRDGPGAFLHASDLPSREVGDGALRVFLGSSASETSPAHVEVPALGAELVVNGRVELGLRPDFEHAIIALDGSLVIGAHRIGPGQIGYLAPGTDELTVLARTARAILIGGEPWTEPLVMWWNFVARSREELADMARGWNERHERFGRLVSPLARIDAPHPAWATQH